jgi:hypothetical protein
MTKKFNPLVKKGIDDAGVQSIQAGTNITVNSSDPANPVVSASGSIGGSVAWGDVTGTLSDQTDLQSALNDKQDSSSALALGETSTTAYRGDRGKTAYDHSQVTTGNPHSVTKTDVGLANADNTSDANKPVSTAQQSALDLKANDNAVVKLTGAQTVAGVKTFSDKPVIPDLSGVNTGDQDLSGKEDVAKLTPIEVSTTTAAGTAAKVGTTVGGTYTPATGDIVRLTLSAANTANNPTLNIDGSGAKSILLGNVNPTAVGMAGTKVMMWYDGTAFQLFGSQRTSDANTTYSEISEAEINTGTASTRRTISGRRAKFIIDKSVQLTGAQTVAGIKTFSDSPVVPAPTTDMQAATKKYVDDNAGGGYDGETLVPNSSLTYDVGTSEAYYSNLYTNRLYLNSTAYLDGDTAGEINASGIFTADNILRGTGSPEGSVSAPVGSIYIDSSAGNTPKLWVKKSGTGNTGWEMAQTTHPGEWRFYKKGTTAVNSSGNSYVDVDIDANFFGVRGEYEFQTSGTSGFDANFTLQFLNSEGNVIPIARLQNTTTSSGVTANSGTANYAYSRLLFDNENIRGSFSVVKSGQWAWGRGGFEMRADSQLLIIGNSALNSDDYIRTVRLAADKESAFVVPTLTVEVKN